MTGNDGTRCGTESNYEGAPPKQHGEGKHYLYGFEALDQSKDEELRFVVSGVSRESAWAKVLDAFRGDVKRLKTKQETHHDLSDWPTLEEVTDTSVTWRQE